MIQRRIKNSLEAFQDEEQTGFRKNRLTMDHLHTVNQLMEKSNEYNITIYLAFIDFNKAFDYLKHKVIWKAYNQPM